MQRKINLKNFLILKTTKIKGLVSGLSLQDLTSNQGLCAREAAFVHIR
jgi:hypothetical protein